MAGRFAATPDQLLRGSPNGAGTSRQDRGVSKQVECWAATAPKRGTRLGKASNPHHRLHPPTHRGDRDFYPLTGPPLLPHEGGLFTGNAAACGGPRGKDTSGSASNLSRICRPGPASFWMTPPRAPPNILGFCLYTRHSLCTA